MGERFDPNAPEPPDRGADSLRCEAKGCPNRWTSEMDVGAFDGRRTRVCQAHAAAPRGLWGFVTNAQLRAAQDVPPELRRLPVDEDEVARQKARLAALRERLRAPQTPLARRWALELRAREPSGRLNKAQRAAWREVLGEPEPPDPTGDLFEGAPS